MNLNNFVVLPSKPKSMKLNVRNLQELRMETVQLDQHAKEMESRLEELRQHMNQEKEEREPVSDMGTFKTLCEQQPTCGVNVPFDTSDNVRGKGMRVYVAKVEYYLCYAHDEQLKESLPMENIPKAEQKQVIAEPAAKVHGTNRKLNLRGKVCGQCEVQLAGLMCAECGEDYCVGCFVRFHQKGALKRHRMVPVQAELQTPVSTRDVLGRLQQQVSGEENQHTQGASHKSTDESEATEKRSAPRSLQPMSDNQMHHTQPQVLFVNDGVDVEDEEAAEEEDSSLLRGGFDEEESARSFQEALKEWRERGQRPVSVMETQTEKGSQQLIHVEFKEDTLSYMEKLLLKKHRSLPLKLLLLRVTLQTDDRNVNIIETTENEPDKADIILRGTENEADVIVALPAERMELHKYFTSLFMIALAEDAGKADSPAESCLSIVELDEKMAGDATLYRSFGVKQGNESKMFAAVGNGGDFGYSVLPFTPCFSEMTKGSVGECNSDIKINSSPEMWPPSQEAEQSSSSLPRSESFSPLQTRLQRSQHLSTASESFLSNSRIGGQKVELSDSPKPSPRTRSSAAQQDKSSELLPTSSPSLPKTKLNQTLPGFEDHISTGSLSPGGIPSVRSSRCHSPAFLISKQSPKPPDSPSPRSRSVSSPVNPVQSRPAHSTPVSEPKLAQLSPERAITSPSAAVPSLKLSLRESSQSGLVSDRSISTMPIYDSFSSSMPRVESSHSEGHRSPPASKWLKGSRRSPKTTMFSLQLNMSDSEEEMTGEDACLVPSEEDSSDEELRRITDAEEQKNGFPSSRPTTTPPAEPHFTFTNLSKSENDNTEPDLFTGSSQAIHSVAQRQDIQPGQYQDLEGILTLGLDPGVLQPSPAPAQSSREEQNHTGSSLVNQLGACHFEEAPDIFVRSTPETAIHSVAQRQDIQPGQYQDLEGILTLGLDPGVLQPSPAPAQSSREEQNHTGSSLGTISRCSPISSRPLSAGTRRPLSRAAEEIMEVQSVEQLDLQDSDEDEEDCLALACLEEEFRHMSTTPLDEGEDSICRDCNYTNEGF
ncbi:zinc finger B-box domain-containing protein 1-like [Sinocyclocheilus rhinocerous]|uniref:zinc finger B-box domain-containing protein 1-like n=1 Tax=Sinocyclocheilus rhinocerous TaxID=307959 RepID=UPI0007BA8306|nr:PREDICTED: zinc finger B-box domain-containing protein 1-like [Sinocyclocheilus rhinocerous]